MTEHDRPASPATPWPRTRGVIAFIEERCTACDLCVRECPDRCIQLSSHLEIILPTTPHGRPRRQAVLDHFTIDFGLCMYCGICIEVCPFDALAWAPESPYPGANRAQLTRDRQQLGRRAV